MTKLWNCPPTVFDQQPEHMIDLHLQISKEEEKAQKKAEKRASQQAK